MPSALLITVIGTILGVIMAYIHRMITTDTSVNNSDSTDGFKQATTRGRGDAPKEWDGEEKLKICSNCGAYNQVYSEYCRKCTSGIRASKEVEGDELSNLSRRRT